MGPFVQMVLGQIISLFGNAALRFVLPLILLRQTGSAAVYGAATALALLPALAGTLAGGVLADRCRKARLMVVLDLAAAGLALGAAASADNLPIVLWAPAALCALYALQGLYQPVVRASLPLLLAGDRLVQGNAVIQLVDTLDELLGPLLGIAGLCAAMGAALWVPLLACGGVALCGFGVMAAAMRFNVWFFARLQAVLPQAQLGRVTGCTMALASLTQPVGQAVYGVLFDVFSACPAGVLLGAGAVSAVFLTGAMRQETEKRPG